MDTGASTYGHHEDRWLERIEGRLLERIEDRLLTRIMGTLPQAIADLLQSMAIEGLPQKEVRAATDDQRGGPSATHNAVNEAWRHATCEEGTRYSVLRQQGGYAGVRARRGAAS